VKSVLSAMLFFINAFLLDKAQHNDVSIVRDAANEVGAAVITNQFVAVSRRTCRDRTIYCIFFQLSYLTVFK